MITRTITTTVADAFCIDKNSKETFFETVTLSGTFKDEKKLNKAIAKMLDSDYIRFVYAENVHEVETLYGMDENEFIKNAKSLPPRNTKNNELETATNN